MLKKTITYTDFNGDETTEDHFFHLSQAELVELEVSHEGGLSEAMARIIAAQDGKAIIAEFKRIVLMAYGKKSADGKRFIKTQELRDEFESSEAYSTLFMELVTDADAAAAFINGVIPAGLAEKAIEVQNQAEKNPPQVMTMAEIREMSAEEYKALSERIVKGEVFIKSDLPG